MSAQRQPALFTPKDIAARWQVSVRMVQTMIERGELPAVRLGPKLLRIRPSDLDAVEASLCPDYSLKRPVINGRSTLVWYVCWSDGRRSHRLSTKQTDKVAAMSFMAQFTAMQALPPERFTVGDLCDAYLAVKEADPTIAYPKAIKNSLSHIKAHFGGLPPSMVTRAAVRIYVSGRRKLVMDSTIDKELRFLRQALKFGVKEGWLTAEPKVETPGAGAARERFLTRSEFATLFFHASPLHLRVFLGLAISTASRGKHILALRWEHVDFERGMIRYPRAAVRSKKRTAPVPINNRLRPLLELAFKARGPLGWVVEWNGDRVLSVRKAYERAVRLAGLSDAHRHDLRRTAASWAIQDGRTFEEIATMLGDSVEITRKHYAMHDPEYLRGVVDSIGQGGRRA